jgi:glutamyl-tRNA reductase
MVSRSEGRAREVADEVGAGTLPFEALPGLLRDADLLATATSAPHTVVSVGAMEQIMADRGRPLAILDLALPRDVEPAVRGIAGVSLFDLDDLSRLVAGTLERRRSEVAVAEAIIDESIDEFTAWYRSREVVPVIRAMRDRAETMRQREIDRAGGALRGLSSDELRAVDHLTRQLLAKVLHDPTARLRQAAAAGADDVVDAARYLFGLDEPTEETKR